MSDAPEAWQVVLVRLEPLCVDVANRLADVRAIKISVLQSFNAACMTCFGHIWTAAAGE